MTFQSMRRLYDHAAEIARCFENLGFDRKAIMTYGVGSTSFLSVDRPSPSLLSLTGLTTRHRHHPHH